MISRVRPLTPEETKKGAKAVVAVSGDKTVLGGGKVGILQCLR